MEKISQDTHFLKEELYKLIQTDISYFEFIQSGSLDGIWYWDLQNPEVMWMSPKFWETLGYDPRQMKPLVSEWQDIIFEDDLKLALDNYDKHLENPNHPYDQIVRYKHKDGSTVWVRCRGIAIRDAKGGGGKPKRMLGAHNDITTIMNLQQELADRDNLKLLNDELLKKPEDEIKLYENVYYNTKLKIIKNQDTTIELTDHEISLFELFIENSNTLFSFSEIEDSISPDKYLTNNAISLIISRIRKKLPMINIKTVYGQGYMFLTE